MNPHGPFRRLAAATAVFLLTASTLPAQAPKEETLLILRSGRSIPLKSLALKGESFTVREALPGFDAGAVIPASAIDHVSGARPPVIATASAELLAGDPDKAIQLLQPLLAELKPTAKISGNYWVEAARLAVIAHALKKDTAKADALTKEVSDATPAQGVDPVGRLAKALALTDSKARLEALGALVDDSPSIETGAQASYFRGLMFLKDRRQDEAIRSFLTIGTLYSAGTVLTTSAAELQAGILLASRKDRREEAVALLQSASTGAPGTLISSEAAKRLERLADADASGEPAEEEE